MPRLEPPLFALSDLVWIWDPEQARIVWATPAAVAFWGARSLDELAERPFPDQDPNRTALNALSERAVARAVRGASGRAAPSDDAGEEIVLFPEGAPARLLAWARARAGESGRSGVCAPIWVAVRVRAAAAPTKSRAALLLGAAQTPLGLIDSAGAALFLNPAAERLATSCAGTPTAPVLAWYREPEAARLAIGAALSRGAYAHAAWLKGDGAGRRAFMLYRRDVDPRTGQALLTVEAQLRGWEDPGLAAEETASAAPSGGRIGRLLCEPETLSIVSAGRDMVALTPEARRQGATLVDLFPTQAAALKQATRRLLSGEERQVRLDVGLDSPYGRGPWGDARLWLDKARGGPKLALELIDLGPERRSLIRRRQEIRAAAGALGAQGVGVALLDRAGAVLNASPAAARMLGLDPAALAAGTAASRPTLPSRLAAPWDARLATHVAETLGAARRAATTPGALAPPPPIDALVKGYDGVARPLRLSLSAPLGFGIEAVCVALSSGGRALAPEELAALGPPFAPGEAETASHAFRTALTTIKGFAELMRDDVEAPPAPRHRRYLDDIAATVSALTDLVDRAFVADRPRARPPRDEAEFGLAPSGLNVAAPIDLRDVAQAAARRAAGRHPVWAPAPAAPAHVSTRRADLDEALDLLLAEAADRGPTRLSVEATLLGARKGAALEIETAAAGPWPPASLRAAELLAERAGARLERAEGGEAAGFDRIRLMFVLEGPASEPSPSEPG